MKTYTDFLNLNKPEFEINESSIKNIGAASFVLRSKTINSQLKQTQIHDSETNKKINLLSDQLLTATYLIAQLGVMKWKRPFLLYLILN